jgi:hypothetical protein
MITTLSQNSDKQECIQNTLVSINVLFFLSGGVFNIKAGINKYRRCSQHGHLKQLWANTTEAGRTTGGVAPNAD